MMQKKLLIEENKELKKGFYSMGLDKKLSFDNQAYNHVKPTAHW